MRGYVANTDYDWFTFLRALNPPVEEVNFWRPRSTKQFHVLSPGQPLFFKLKAPHSVIAGLGYFAHFSALPVTLAWQVFGVGNGAASYPEMRRRLAKLRSKFGADTDRTEDFKIGCILVNQPLFFADHDWIRIPDDWAPNNVQGKGYDLTSGEGKRIWLECLARAGAANGSQLADAREIAGGFGSPSLIRPRLGQGSFRIAVLDTYERRCAITNERTLPALEAAHIRQFAEVPEHFVNNGILFRADIHKLFDAGYVTVDPDYHFIVSRRIKEEFENGRDYYKLHGSPLRLPARPSDRPLAEVLQWHNEERFLG